MEISEINSSVSDKELRKKVEEIQIRWDLTLSEIARSAGHPLTQGALSKFMRKKSLGEDSRSKLILFLNRLVKRRPPKEARYIMREPFVLDREATIGDTLTVFEKEDICACIFEDEKSPKIVTEKGISTYRKRTQASDKAKIKEVTIAKEPFMATPFLPYKDLQQFFRGRQARQAILIVDPKKIDIVGIITEHEVHPAPDLFGNPAKRFWKRRGGKYVNQMLPRKAAEILSERILATLKGKPRKQRVLDLGTGPLNFAVAYSQKVRTALIGTETKINAVDHEIEQFKETANRRRDELGLTNVDTDFDDHMKRLKSWRDEFDIVAFNMVLPAYSTMVRPSLRVRLEDAIRVLKPRGKIAVSYYDKGFLESLLGILESVFNKHGRYFWRAITQLFSLPELNELLTREGFTIKSSGTESVEADDIRNGEDLFEFLMCSQIAVDFSFMRCSRAMRHELRKDIVDALEKAFRKPEEFEVSFPINFVVASK